MQAPKGFTRCSQVSISASCELALAVEYDGVEQGTQVMLSGPWGLDSYHALLHFGAIFHRLFHQTEQKVGNFRQSTAT